MSRIVSKTIDLSTLGGTDEIKKYISTIGPQGITIHPQNQNNQNFIQIDSDGMSVYKNNTEVANFGTTTTIGVTDNTQSYLLLDYHSMQMIDKEGNLYFSVRDLRNEDGEAEIIETSVGDGTTVQYYLQFPSSEIVSIKINDVETTAYHMGGGTFWNKIVVFDQAPADSSIITFTYLTLSTFTKAYTIGTRRDNSYYGAYSFACGYSTTASGVYSVAEGHDTTASGLASHAEGSFTTASNLTSHAEGNNTTASGDVSHAEGDSTTASGSNSHAEGYYTTASDYASHAEGSVTTASGFNSHAQNYLTNAQKSCQTALGTCNIVDTSTTTTHPSGISSYGRYGIIFGNGTADNARSNALTVEWNGNTTIAGTLTQSSDRKLKDHLSYLSTDAHDFIRSLKPAYYKKDNQPHVGFYAQDVEQVDKWHCMTGEMNGFKTLGYTEIIAPLVAYCQHLEKRIEELENQ